MSMRGYPDWGRPTRVGDTPGWAAFEEPGVVLVPYAALAAAPVGPTADVTVDVFAQDRHADGIVAFGLVTLGFALAHRAPAAADGPRSRLAPSGRGVVQITAPAALGLPEGLLTPQELLPATGRTLTTTLRLGEAETEIVVAALQRELRTVGAAAWIESPGVAERVPGTLRVEVHRFLAAVREARPDGVVTRDQLGALVETDPAALSVRTTVEAGGPAEARDDDVAARARTGAVLDRLLGSLGDFVPPPDPATPGAWVLPEPGATGTLTWDLDRPVLAPRSVRVATDPVVDRAAAGSRTVDVRRHDAAALPDGRHRIVLRATVPDSPVGVLDVGVDLTAAPAPPDRPFSVEAGVRLADVWASATRTTETELALAPAEPLAYALRATSILPTSSGLVPVEGPTRQVTGDSSPVVTPADLALRFLPVQATASLLEHADVVVTLTAGIPGAGEATTTYDATARLHAGAPSLHLTLPVRATAASLVAVAEDPVTRRRSAPVELPVGGVLLDLFTFPDPPWATGPGTPAPPEPAMTSLETAGLRLSARTATDWEFAPLTAGVARTPDGAPQLTVLSAGGPGHLAVTTTLRADDHQLAQARDALAARLGGDAASLTLTPEQVTATGVTLLLRAADGTWAALAEGSPSGTFLQECSFSVPLDAARLDVVRRATAGEPDLLRVTYALTSRPRATASADGTTGATSSSTTSSTTTTSTTSTTSTSTSSTAVTTTRSPSSGPGPTTSTAARHDEETTTAATAAAQPGTAWTVTSDASTWGAGPTA